MKAISFLALCSITVNLFIAWVLLQGETPTFSKRIRRESLYTLAKPPTKKSPYGPLVDVYSLTECTGCTALSALLSDEVDSEFYARTAVKHHTEFSLHNVVKARERRQEPRISLHVFAWKRVKSLKRLLESLASAEYGDRRDVELIMHVEKGAGDEVWEVVRGFQWEFGKKMVEGKGADETRVATNGTGLGELMTDAWKPKDDNDLAIFLEDDVEVSPLFFEYALHCSKLFLLPVSHHKKTIGCSLYTPRLDEISPTDDPQNPPKWTPEKAFANTTYEGTSLYYMQLPCSWGAVYSGKLWKEYIEFFKWRKRKGRMLPALPNARSNLWKHSWKRFLIEYMYIQGLVMVYPSFPNQTSFSTNYYEQGVHSAGDGKPVTVPDVLRTTWDERFTVPLIQRKETETIWAKLPKNGKEADKMRRHMPVVNLQHEIEEGGVETLFGKSKRLRNWVKAKKIGDGKAVKEVGESEVKLAKVKKQEQPKMGSGVVKANQSEKELPDKLKVNKQSQGVPKVIKVDKQQKEILEVVKAQKQQKSVLEVVKAEKQQKGVLEVLKEDKEQKAVVAKAESKPVKVGEQPAIVEEAESKPVEAYVQQPAVVLVGKSQGDRNNNDDDEVEEVVSTKDQKEQQAPSIESKQELQQEPLIDKVPDETIGKDGREEGGDEQEEDATKKKAVVLESQNGSLSDEAEEVGRESANDGTTKEKAVALNSQEESLSDGVEEKGRESVNDVLEKEKALNLESEEETLNDSEQEKEKALNLESEEGTLNDSEQEKEKALNLEIEEGTLNDSEQEKEKALNLESEEETLNGSEQEKESPSDEPDEKKMEGEKYGEADEHDYKMDLVDKKEDHARDHKNEIARKESVQFDEDEDENEHAELLYNDEMSDDSGRVMGDDGGGGGGSEDVAFMD